MKKITKEQILLGYQSRQLDIENILKGQQASREIERLYKEMAAKNDLTLEVVELLECEEFLERLKDYMIDSCATTAMLEEYEVCHVPDYVLDRCVFQEEEYFDLRVYINQTCDGGIAGDSYSGTIYVKLPESKMYFMFYYSC